MVPPDGSNPPTPSSPLPSPEPGWTLAQRKKQPRSQNTKPTPPPLPLLNLHHRYDIPYPPYTASPQIPPSQIIISVANCTCPRCGLKKGGRYDLRWHSCRNCKLRSEKRTAHWSTRTFHKDEWDWQGTAEELYLLARDVVYNQGKVPLELLDCCGSYGFITIPRVLATFVAWYEDGRVLPPVSSETYSKVRGLRSGGEWAWCEGWGWCQRWERQQLEEENDGGAESVWVGTRGDRFFYW